MSKFIHTWSGEERHLPQDEAFVIRNPYIPLFNLDIIVIFKTLAVYLLMAIRRLFFHSAADRIIIMTTVIIHRMQLKA